MGDVMMICSKVVVVGLCTLFMGSACIQVPEATPLVPPVNSDIDKGDMAQVDDGVSEDMDVDLFDGRTPDLFSEDMTDPDITIDMNPNPDGRSDMDMTIATPVNDEDDACVVALGVDRGVCPSLPGQYCAQSREVLTEADLRLNGDASIKGGVVTLIPESSSKIGSVFPLPHNLNVNESMFIKSTLSVIDSDNKPGAGFALVFQTRGQGSVGLDGQYLGAGFDQNQFVIEFHTRGVDGADSPESEPHVRMISRRGYDTPLFLESWPATAQPNGKPLHIWLDYYAPCETMALYLSSEDTKPDAPTFTLNYNLNVHFSTRGPLFIGWSAGNTIASDSIELSNWTITHTGFRNVVQSQDD